MSTNATYVYCLIESPRPPSLSRTPRGLPAGTPPALLAIGTRLWAVVADVPLSEYGSARLEQRLRDINWVADMAVAHEAVVERFASAKRAAVVPMKLFTMFSTRERAMSELAARRGAIDTVLERIRGCREWGIRVTHAAPPRVTGSRASTPATGTAFLIAKKRARDQARDRQQRAADAAERTFDSLARLARGAHRRAAPADATTPPLVDAAFLVSDVGQTRFKAAVKRAARLCRDADAALVLTGPWPAYNFVQSLPEGA